MATSAAPARIARLRRALMERLAWTRRLGPSSAALPSTTRSASWIRAVRFEVRSFRASRTNAATSSGDAPSRASTASSAAASSAIDAKRSSGVLASACSTAASRSGG